MVGWNLRDNANWVKSTRSAGNGQCVEVAKFGGCVAIRDSKDTDGPMLQFSATSWQSFVSSLAAKADDE
ncbi:DUF397 domain-containing protein [Micromonospora sp. CPCC 206061]|uniref:DUF397 domain-containing protein n=1 Tax=Micromonospora sp. CPCC 206061 TaxID=3122410 RepID=UPI002FF0F8A5